MLSALLRPIFTAGDGDAARDLFGDAVERLRKPLPKLAELLEEAEEDLLAAPTSSASSPTIALAATSANHSMEAVFDQAGTTTAEEVREQTAARAANDQADEIHDVWDLTASGVARVQKTALKC